MSDEIRIEIDLEKITFGDLRLFLSCQNESQDPKVMVSLIEALDRIVVGGIDRYPLSMAGDIVEAINSAVAESANPEDAEGKNSESG